MDPDVHLWGGNLAAARVVVDGPQRAIRNKEWLYKTLCGDFVPWLAITFHKQPTCMGCILVRFQQKAEDAA
jgi:hypothetical protein